MVLFILLNFDKNSTEEATLNFSNGYSLIGRL